MIPRDSIIAAAQKLLEASPRGSEVILFGSHARGEPRSGSDLDFLVIEPAVSGRLKEAARLLRALRPLRLPIDVVVTDQQTFDRWKTAPSTICHEAARDGWKFGPI